MEPQQQMSPMPMSSPSTVVRRTTDLESSSLDDLKDHIKTRRERINLYYRTKRMNETPDERARRLDKMNTYYKNRRLNETAEEREFRLSKTRRYNAAKREKQKLDSLIHDEMLQQQRYNAVIAEQMATVTEKLHTPQDNINYGVNVSSGVTVTTGLNVPSVTRNEITVSRNDMISQTDDADSNDPDSIQVWTIKQEPNIPVYQEPEPLNERPQMYEHVQYLQPPNIQNIRPEHQIQIHNILKIPPNNITTIPEPKTASDACEDERAKRREARNLYYKNKRLNETPDERERRLNASRKYIAAKRQRAQ